MRDFPPPHDQPPAYTNRKGAYTAVPQFDYGPPTGYSAPSAPPPSGYAPAPPVFQQQSSSVSELFVNVCVPLDWEISENLNLIRMFRIYPSSLCNRRNIKVSTPLPPKCQNYVKDSTDCLDKPP